MSDSATRKLRICFPFADREREVGGSHISAMTLIKGLDRNRFDPQVVLQGEEGKVGSLAVSAGQTPHRIKPSAIADTSLSGSMRAIKEATSYLKDGQYDVVHTNEGRMHVLWGLAAKMAGIAQVWHHRADPKAKGLNYLSPLTANEVISVSKFSAPKPGLYSSAGRCAVIHSPFDTSIATTDRAVSRAGALAELGLEDDAQLVGYFGHYSDRKRPLVFIDAIAAAVKARPDRKIVGLMFGEEYDPGLLGRMEQAIASHGLGDNLRLMGFRKPAEPWIAACDAMLVSAVNEPFGRTLVEAFLLGTPVIAAASGGNLEAIDEGRTGLLATADDVEALSNALLKVLDDKDFAQKLANNAKADALDKFGIDTHVRSVEAVYEKILRRVDRS